MWRRVLQIAKRGAVDLVRDGALTLGAAVAFYATLAVGPLFMLLVAMGGFMSASGHDRLIAQVETLIGPTAGEAAGIVMKNVGGFQDRGSATIALAAATLAISVTGAFAQLQFALNRIWDVRVSPGRRLREWLRKRALSLILIVGFGFIVIVSVFVSALVSEVLPAWRWEGSVVTFIAYTLLLAMTFKLLPDVTISFRDVWTGAVVTAVLLSCGKFVIGLYLGHSILTLPYGAAGSLVALLVWMYYASLIVFYGAELTQVYAHMSGRRIEPSKYAEWDPSGKLNLTPR